MVGVIFSILGSKPLSKETNVLLIFLFAPIMLPLVWIGEGAGFLALKPTEESNPLMGWLSTTSIFLSAILYGMIMSQIFWTHWMVDNPFRQSAIVFTWASLAILIVFCVNHNIIALVCGANIIRKKPLGNYTRDSLATYMGIVLKSLDALDPKDSNLASKSSKIYFSSTEKSTNLFWMSLNHSLFIPALILVGLGILGGFSWGTQVIFIR